MKLSFLLPSIFPPLCWRFIESFRRGGWADYEIVVCSPFEISGDRIVWTRDERQIGYGPAVRQAFTHSTGEVVGVGSDDILILPDSLRGFMEEYQRHPDDLWNMRGIWCGTVFGKFFCGYPCTSRATIEKLWQYYFPYMHHGGDPCLSLGAHRHGIALRSSATQVVTINIGDRLGCPHSPAKEDAHDFEFSKQQLAKEFPEYSQGWSLEGITMYR